MLTASCHDSNTIYKQKLRMLYNSYSRNTNYLYNNTRK